MSEVALVARAAAYAGLTALIGTAPVRFTANHIPQDSLLPAVGYTRISGVTESAMGVDTGVTRNRFQVTAVALTYSGARDVVTQLKAAFRRYRGTSGGVVVQDTMIENETDAGHDPDLKSYGRSVDILMYTQE